MEDLSCIYECDWVWVDVDLQRSGLGRRRSRLSLAATTAETEESGESALCQADKVADNGEKLFVAAGGGGLDAGSARHGAGGARLAAVSSPLDGHALRLALLRLRELRRDDDQTKIDHEERPDLTRIHI